MPSYFSVLVPYVPREFQTEWHPDKPDGPFSTLTRGAFPTFGGAIDWARKHLNGAPYSVREYQVPAEKSTNVSAQHVDTCLSSYLQDHHNRDAELLLGIEPCGQTVDEAASQLATEAEVNGDDRLPGDLTRDELILTFKRGLAGVDLRHINGNGGRWDYDPANVECIDCDATVDAGEVHCQCCNDNGERAQVWILLSWETV